MATERHLLKKAGPIYRGSDWEPLFGHKKDVKVSALTGNSSKAGAKKPWPLLNESGQVQIIFRCPLDCYSEA